MCGRGAMHHGPFHPRAGRTHWRWPYRCRWISVSQPTTPCAHSIVYLARLGATDGIGVADAVHTATGPARSLVDLDPLALHIDDDLDRGLSDSTDTDYIHAMQELAEEGGGAKVIRQARSAAGRVRLAKARSCLALR